MMKILLKLISINYNKLYQRLMIPNCPEYEEQTSYLFIFVDEIKSFLKIISFDFDSISSLLLFIHHK